MQTAFRFRIYPRIRFNQRVICATWSDSTGKWNVVTEDGTKIVAYILVHATGARHVPHKPDFLGKEEYTGESYHTAEWKKDFDPLGKIVAVIGTGASAVQAVPALSTQGVEKLLVFQRTPCWAPPKYNFFYNDTVKQIFKRFPFTQTFLRYFNFWKYEISFVIFLCKNTNFLIKKLTSWYHNQIRMWYKSEVEGDCELLTKLMPSYKMGSKRVTPSDKYIATFVQPCVQLITDRIKNFTSNGIRTVKKEFKVDTIIFATEFDLQASTRPFVIYGENGQNLGERFSDIPRAYNGITNKYAPNYFILGGPGTGLRHNSKIFMKECQVIMALGRQKSSQPNPNL